MISEKIGLAAMLEQTAEEAAELIHACLKLSRLIRGENPTPISEEDALQAVREEIADVYVCTTETMHALGIPMAEVVECMNVKIERAKERLK